MDESAETPPRSRILGSLFLYVTILLAIAAGVGATTVSSFSRYVEVGLAESPLTVSTPSSKLDPRIPIETSGYSLVQSSVQWSGSASLEEISQIWGSMTDRLLEELNRQLAAEESLLFPAAVAKACCLLSAGETQKAYDQLQEIRQWLEHDNRFEMERFLSTIIYFQGVVALRLGEDQNCVMCRGESSCILPISSAAIHQYPEGSRLAIRHFTEYLIEFPDDLEVRWLLNLAHMTLGEYPDLVDPRFLVDLKKFNDSTHGIGKFRDIGHVVGVNRFNISGGAIMDDFDNDGLLDIVVTSLDATQSMGLYRNRGDGKFEECAKAAGVIEQLGGLICVQTDYNNDSLLDIYIGRGAWLRSQVRPTLLRNDGDGGFTDVTLEAGLMDPVNTNAAQWADYDNDGWVDLFVCCERQPHRLYRNRGNGTFEEVSSEAGIKLGHKVFGKGCTWIDYDNDDYPDLFINDLIGQATLFHNERDGTFLNVTDRMGIDGPTAGFSCWSWDYNNDGWMDLFAASADRTLEDIVKGLTGEPHRRRPNRLYLNEQGQRFRDVTEEAGLDMVFAAMGSNYGDFDNDGFLDMYLGTGAPDFALLVPNRMFRNMAGNHFAEITSSAGVGHLQKGHAIACGDWDRDGNVDVFMQTGGAVDGDRYHNILFQNPGNDHKWLTVKLVGRESNRAAHGVRIKVVTSAKAPLTIHRHVSSGSSFGGNPLEQTIGLGDADRIAVLEVHWPTSGTTQVIRDIQVNQSIEVVEFERDYRTLSPPRVTLPE